MKLRFLSVLAVASILTSFPAFALDLHQARSSGLVGEKLDGYTTALKATPEVTALVTEVNAKRKQEYARISAQNGQPLDVVAKLAAAQIMSGLEPGSSYQAADGSWKKR